MRVIREKYVSHLGVEKLDEDEKKKLVTVVEDLFSQKV